MKHHKTYSFIEGIFEPLDAKELLLELFREKMKFHNTKNFSSIIRFNKPIIGSKEKVDELRKTKEDIVRLIGIALANNKKLKIVSEIKIYIDGD